MGAFTYFKFDYFDVKTLKIVLANTFYVLGYSLIKNEDDFDHMLKGLYYSFIFFVANILIYNIFDFGTSDAYNIDVNFRFGGQGINTVQLLPFFMFSAIIFYSRKKCHIYCKVIIMLLLTYSSFILVFSTKRGSLLALLIGLIYYFYRTKFNINKTWFLAFVFIGLMYFINKYSQQIDSIYNRREERINLFSEDREFTKEGRYLELLMIFQEVKNNPHAFLFGRGIGSEYFIPRNRRMIHTDINVIFYALGITGTFIYFLLFWKILKSLRWYNKQSMYINNKTFIIISFIMIINLIFIGISGSLHVIQNRSFPLFVLGGCIGLLRSNMTNEDIIYKD